MRRHLSLGDTFPAVKICYNTYFVLVLGEKQPIQYPVQTIVPISMTSKDLIEVAEFHRFVLTWAGLFKT